MQPGILYLFRHDDLRALKVGITNQTIDRLTKHERFGWTLVDLWFHDVGEDARLVEEAVLARRRGRRTCRRPGTPRP